MPTKTPFTSKELALFRVLRKRRIPFLIVGLSAATLQGAPVVTQDIDLWFKDLTDPNFHKTLREVGGFYVPPWGINPPQVGGEGLELVDVVTNVDGLRSFDYEYRHSRTIKLGNVSVRILPLERIIKSKRALGRKKDKAVLPILEDVLRAVKAKKK